MKIETLEVVGFRPALHGMRQPLNSHHRADSGIDPATGKYELGANDRGLAERLCKNGEEHAKFLRMIHVYADITAPLYWWKEFDTYRVGVEKNSGSTMHTILNKEFELSDFEHGMLSPNCVRTLHTVVAMLNQLREDHGRQINSTLQEMYQYQIIQLLPESYLQTRTVDMSYAALRKVLRQRKNHKLRNEWVLNFRTWAKSLPESWLLFEEESK